jgi:4-nitrophenyl phosphatase
MTGFLIDLDGTLHRGKEPIPYADTFIKLLQAREIPFLLVTNNSSRTPEQVAHHLLNFGIEVTAEDIYTSAQAASAHLSELQNGNKVYMIGETGLHTALEESGLILTDVCPDYVVQGIDREFNYTKLAAAVGFILEGARFVQTNPDLLLPSDHGFIPGAGSIAASIVAATRVEPILIGKPSPIIMKGAIRRLGLSAKEVWVVGDNAATDIRGGAVAGCLTAMVLTGVATAHNVQEQITRAGVTPDLICTDLQELAAKVLQA